MNINYAPQSLPKNINNNYEGDTKKEQQINFGLKLVLTWLTNCSAIALRFSFAFISIGFESY